MSEQNRLTIFPVFTIGNFELDFILEIKVSEVMKEVVK